MKNSRRQFIKAGVLGGTLAATGLPLVGHAGEEGPCSKKPLSILILGGTGFIGPHMVREALRRGHDVTLFNRGRTNDDLFPDLETITGDRDGGLDGLVGRKWDAVIDNSGYIPRHVQDSARLLAPNVGQYLYISTVAVYADFNIVNTEDSPLASIDDESIEEVTGQTYGPLKALCEKRAEAEVPADKLCILRPTYICGPGDHTDRFTYWPVRTREGGAMLWPGSPSDAIQIIDVRDLAVFTVDSLDRHITGIYNMVNPVGSYTMGDLLADSAAISAADVEAIWVSEPFLYEQGLIGGRNLPIWHPHTGPDAASGSFSGKRALDAGLCIRPQRETARDTLTWWNTLPEERTSNLRAGLEPDQEEATLLAWVAENS